MARGNLTIYDVPAEVRAKGAAEARKSLHQMLSNPHITSEQRRDLHQRLQWCSKWETLNVSEIVEKTVPVQNHKVDLSESLTVKEKATKEPQESKDEVESLSDSGVDAETE